MSFHTSFKSAPAHPKSRTELTALTAEYLANGGTIRRFAPGVSGSVEAMQQVMASVGYRLLRVGNCYTLTRIGAKGRPKRLNGTAMRAKLDEILIANGQLPFLSRGEQ